MTMPEEPSHRPSIHDVKPIPVPKIGHWIGGAVLAVFAVVFLQVLVTNKNMQWSVVAEYMFSPTILSGLGMTLLLTILAMVLGLAIGVVLAIMRLSSSRVFQSVSWGWIWFFRGVPPKLISWSTNALITPFSAAIMGLAFTESAYAAEMIRAGIQAVAVGQTEAGATLGMTRGQTLRRIVLPQALRIVIPPIGNDTISMLKFTSLVSVLALPDLLYSAQMVYARTYQTVPLLLVATIWYLVLTTVLTAIEHAVEHRLKSEHHRAGSGKLRGFLSFRLFARQKEPL
jgi:polar amino acid transport system permease protein